jgi:PAS domain S-box-containing protein
VWVNAATEITGRQQLMQLQAVADTALSSLNLAELLPAVLDRVCHAMQVDSAAILLMAENGQELRVLAGRGALDSADIRIPLGQGIAGRIAATRLPLIVDDLSEAEVVSPLLRAELRSLAGVPLMVEGRRIGVLQVGTAASRTFTEADLRLLQLAGDRIALAIDHARLYELAQAGYAEADARASELFATFATMTDGVLVTDRQGRGVRSNLAFRHMFGLEARPDTDGMLPHERSVLLNIRDAHNQLLPPERLPTSRILRGEVLQGPTAQDITVRTLDGRILEVNVTGAPVRTADDGIVGAVAVLRDVTERRRLERQVMEQANQLEATFEAIADGVFVFDKKGRIQRNNAAERGMLGLGTAAEAHPQTVLERGQLLMLRDEHGLRIPRTRWPAFRVLRGEDLRGNVAMEVRARTTDGRELEISVSGAPIRDQAGHIIGGVLVNRDVTDRRKLERRTRDALQSLLRMAEALVSPEHEVRGSTGRDGSPVLRRLAELGRSLLGCERIGFLALDPVTEHLKPLLSEGWPAEASQQWITGQGLPRLHDLIARTVVERLRAGEVVVIDADATGTAPYGWSVPGAGQLLLAPLRIGANLVGLLALDFGGCPHDYTSDEHALASAVAQLAAVVIERERLLREREEALAAELVSREATQRMELFMALAGHEFRAPLTVIKGYLQLAERALASRLPDVESATPLGRALLSARESLGQVEQAALRLSSLLADLLQVTRAQTGKLHMSLQPCDLTDVVQKAVDEQRQAQPLRQVRVRLPAQRLVPVLADPERLGEVVTNYLTNAFKYSPEHQPVDVRLQVKSTQVRVSVHDRGPGVPAHERERIWERFYQAPEVPRQSGSDAGLGLGLYICKTIIDEHAGQVGVDSTTGRGSTFWFTLPLNSGNT